MSRRKEKFLNMLEIKLLSPQELIKYKHSLIQYFNDMQDEIEEFKQSYKNTNKILNERLIATKLALKKAEQDRINLDPDFPSIIYDETMLSIN